MPQGKSRTTLLYQEQLDEQKVESNSSDIQAVIAEEKFAGVVQDSLLLTAIIIHSN